MIYFERIKKVAVKYNKFFIASLVIAVILTLSIFSIYYIKTKHLKTQVKSLANEKLATERTLMLMRKELTNLKSQDQYVINKNLREDIKKIETSYKKTAILYEKLLDLKDLTKKTEKFDESFAKTIQLLSERNYASAEAKLVSLDKEIENEKSKITSAFTIPKNVPVNNTPPNSGYSSQQVKADIGTFLVDIIAADLNTARVIVDTASDSDCKDNCSVLPLSDYASRNGAFAGINGSYFCPASYPSCAGKTNSFDTLLMNKNKKYLNSDNNIYSTVPAVIFLGGSVRYVGQSLEWGRDTGVDGVIANQPLLLSGGNIVFGGSGDPKQGSKGSRSFVGSKGNTAYIGVVHNATVAEVAHALKAMGLEGALNLDSGGSVALWHNGYKVGPGRNIPNAILFVRK